MSHLEEWAKMIAKQLKSEAELVSTQAKSELYQDAARETFIRVVLEPFLPASYAVSSGRVIDATGSISEPQDIVIYRKDYPQFNMPGSHNVFIYESVVATIQVCSKLVRKTFFNALDQCASMGTLEPAIEADTIKTMAAKMRLQLDAQQQYVHEDPINTGRFNLIGRPQTFIYAFTGFQTSDRQLTENLEKWFEHYHQQHDAIQMKSLPSVIATQGCFAWRNTAPFMIKDRILLGIGNDHAPLRLMILQLMQAFNRRLQNTSDGYGIKSSITPYLNQFERPSFTNMVGVAENPGVKLAVVNSEIPAAAATDADDQSTDSSATELNATGEDAASANNQAKPDSVGSVIDIQAKTSLSAPSTVGQETPAAVAQDTPFNQSESPASVPNQGLNDASQPAALESAGQEPVIENRSRRLPTRPQAEANQPDAPPKPNRLSMFGNNEEQVDEYKFEPIEPKIEVEPDETAIDSTSNDVSSQAVSNVASENRVSDVSVKQPVSNDTKQAVTSNELDFESTQKIDTSQLIGKQNEGEESDGEFLDTLIEKPEANAKEKTEPAPVKSQYVTESILQ